MKPVPRLAVFSWLTHIGGLLLLCFFFSQACQAQPPAFQHIIYVIQENRTPDNLFSDCGIPGADLTALGAGIALRTTPIIKNLPHLHKDFLVNLGGNWLDGAKTHVAERYVDPYCQMAKQYGFANRMFQTSQGPSFPAHQFLFGGTSSPDTRNILFASEEPVSRLGCIQRGLVAMIDQNGNENTNGVSCFERPVLSDEIHNAGLSWRYYVASSIWGAPLTISHICQVKKGSCTGSEFENQITNPPQVLSDIAACNMASVSWVTPAGLYSDHPYANNGSGPSWVASIVNAVGTQPQCPNGETYWNNTLILVTWDDWGGFYDHVSPLQNNTGWCVSYCYGFRVPLIVISAYTPAMTDNVPHDFGSMLHAVETNFGFASLGYADAFADDLSNFFTLDSPRPFIVIKTHHLSARVLADRSDPDNDGDEQ